jgi:hypothetical protein
VVRQLLLRNILRTRFGIRWGLDPDFVTPCQREQYRDLFFAEADPESFLSGVQLREYERAFTAYVRELKDARATIPSPASYPDGTNDVNYQQARDQARELITAIRKNEPDPQDYLDSKQELAYQVANANAEIARARAKKVCAEQCPFRLECLARAVRADTPHGERLAITELGPVSTEADVELGQRFRWDATDGDEAGVWGGYDAPDREPIYKGFLAAARSYYGAVNRTGSPAAMTDEEVAQLDREAWDLHQYKLAS